MKLLFLRHGEADWAEWLQPDDERPLTKCGKKEMRKVGKFLRKLDLEVELIVTSPLPRAAQTAKIAGKKLDVAIEEAEELRPGFSAAKLRGLAKKHPYDTLILVGHNPDFTEVIRALTGADVKLAKAGVALIEANAAATKGQLLGLFSPKIARG